VSETVPYRVVIIGGGITGLAAAHRLVELSRQSKRPLDIKLIEASSRVGGVIETHSRVGFLLEGGPDSFITERPWGLDLCKRLGLDDQLIGITPENRRSFIARGNRLHEVPEGFYLLAPSRIFPFLKSPIISWGGKMRMALDLALPRKTDDREESLAEFVTRRLGREVLERVAQPMVGGIYTADPRKLSVKATMPRFLEMEAKHRSLILAMMRSRRNSGAQSASGPRYGLFASFKSGMQTMVDALAARLPKEAIRVNERVESLEQIKNGGTGVPPVEQEQSVAQASLPVLSVKNSANAQAGTPVLPNSLWRIRTNAGNIYDADAVCLTLPSFEMARLLKNILPPLASELREIPYSSVATLNLAYRRADVPHPLNGSGFVIPAIEKRTILACTFCSSKYAGRAPDGTVLIRAFIGGAMFPEVLEKDDRTIIADAREDLQELLGVAVAPLLAELKRYPFSMTQYYVGHVTRIERIQKLAQQLNGIHLTTSSLEGVGVPGCIHRGERAAEKMFEAWGAL
jgi:oxygen-dependent protoporphyrinogen oxidase